MNILRRGVSSAVLLAAVAVSVAAAAVPADPDLQARVDVEVRRAPVARFADALSAQARVNFVLPESLDGARVTLMLHDVTAAEALDVLREAAGIDHRRLAGRTYLLAPAGSPELRAAAVVDGGPELDRRVTVNVKGATLDRYLSALSAQSRVSFALEPGLEDRRVTAFLKNVTVREALEVVLTLKGLSCRPLRAREAYAVSPRPVRG